MIYNRLAGSLNGVKDANLLLNKDEWSAFLFQDISYLKAAWEKVQPKERQLLSFEVLKAIQERAGMKMGSNVCSSSYMSASPWSRGEQQEEVDMRKVNGREYGGRERDEFEREGGDYQLYDYHPYFVFCFVL